MALSRRGVFHIFFIVRHYLQVTHFLAFIFGVSGAARTHTHMHAHTHTQITLCMPTHKGAPVADALALHCRTVPDSKFGLGIVGTLGTRSWLMW